MEHRGLLTSSFGPPSQIHLPPPAPALQHSDMSLDASQDELMRSSGATAVPAAAPDPNIERVKQVIEYQFELEVVCKKRELLLIDSRLRNAETMLKQMSDDSPSQPPLVADEPQETEADFDDEKTKATQPILYARRKDGQYVRVRCPVCNRDRFSSKMGFTVHCRLAHQLRFVSAEDAVGSCGKPVPESEVPPDDPCRQDALPPPPPKKRAFTAIDKTVADDDVSRFHITRRLIIGNTCEKVAPAHTDEGDATATHRWMVYVRPSPDEPNLDLASFITKVRFFLHPSFAPNDVVEIVKPPFSLRRRGWGEFPLRVQLHFKHPQRNRAVDVIHHLKLHAETAPGVQALGAETPVEIHLDRRTFEAELMSDNKVRRVTNVAELTEKEIGDVLSVLADAAQEYVVVKPHGPSRALSNLPYAVALSEAMWDSWNIGRQRASEWARARCLRAIIENRLGLALTTKAVLGYTIACGLSPRPPLQPLPEEPPKKPVARLPGRKHKDMSTSVPAPKSALEVLSQLAAPGTLSTQPIKAEESFFCKYCGSQHTPQLSFNNLQVNCGRMHAALDYVTTVTSSQAYRRLAMGKIEPPKPRPQTPAPATPAPAVPAAAGAPAAAPAAPTAPAAPAAPVSASVLAMRAAAGLLPAPSAPSAPSAPPQPAGVLLPETKYRLVTPAASHLKNVDMKTAAQLMAPLFVAAVGSREDGVDEVVGAVGVAFLRRLLRGVVLHYRKQQACETVEETKHKMVVPLHVFEVIKLTPQLFDLLTNDGLGK